MQFKKIRNVHDQYKTQEMCHKVVNNYAHALESDPDCYKTHTMCNIIHVRLLTWLNKFLKRNAYKKDVNKE